MITSLVWSLNEKTKQKKKQVKTILLMILYFKKRHCLSHLSGCIGYKHRTTQVDLHIESTLVFLLCCSRGCRWNLLLVISGTLEGTSNSSREAVMQKGGDHVKSPAEDSNVELEPQTSSCDAFMVFIRLRVNNSTTSFICSELFKHDNHRQTPSHQQVLVWWLRPPPAQRCPCVSAHTFII